MSEIKDKVKQDVMWIVLATYHAGSIGSSISDVSEVSTEEILSIPELAIVDREAIREFYDEGHQVQVEIPAGWVKELK